MSTGSTLSPEALEFFRKKGAEGGKARANRLTPKQLRRIGKKGARALAAKRKKKAA